MNYRSSPYPRAEKRGRSPSPSHYDTPSQRRRTSPPPYTQYDSPTCHGWGHRPSNHKADRFFQSGAGQTKMTLSACTLCLGHHQHNIAKCSSSTLWDQRTPAHCSCNEFNCLVNPKGIVLCSNWQQPNGCDNTTHDSCHECSGCRKTDHGAQKCPQGEKA